MVCTPVAWSIFFYILFAPPCLFFNGFLSLIVGLVITCLLLILWYRLLLLKIWYSVVALKNLLMFSVGSAYWLGHSHRCHHILWHNDSCGCTAVWTWADCNSRKMALHSDVSVLLCWDLFNLVVGSCFVVPTAQCKCVTGCVLCYQSVFKRSNFDWLGPSLLLNVFLAASLKRRMIGAAHNTQFP